LRPAYYRADTSFRTPDGSSDAIGNALTAFGSMKDTPVLLKTSGSDDAGFGVLAGRSRHGRTLQILVSNYQIAASSLGPRPNGDILHIPNIMDITLLPRRALEYKNNGGYDLSVHVPEGKYRVTRYRIDATHNFVELDQVMLEGPQLRLQAVLPPPSIELVKITLQ
jgi:hypothetical protein